MRRSVICALVILLIICPLSDARNTPTFPTTWNSKTITTNNARPGFYLEIKRSYIRAYPGWQKKTIVLLRSKGFAAFNGDPKNQTHADNMWSMESLERTSKPKAILSSVYVGPYPSGPAAEQMVPKLLSALKPLIDDEKKHDELNNRYLFLVGVVRVM